MSTLELLSTNANLENHHNKKTLLVIRHSERLDEVDITEWKRICRTASELQSRDMYSFSNDPPLTSPNGTGIACLAAETISTMVLSDGFNISRVYASKLRRAYETAYPLALKLNIPMYVSSGLALTAIAVHQSNGQFQFQSLDEIQSKCSGVQIIDCDVIEDMPHSLVWSDYINHIAEMHTHSMIVAHRETIRYLFGQYVETPYCCIANFTMLGANEFSLNQVLCPNGVPVMDEECDT